MPDPKRLPDFVYGKTTYVVEKFETTGETLDCKYILRGPRGAEYGLIPNRRTPTHFFAINAKRFTSGTPFEGKWFTERDGALVLA
jgi:hypothetical protein